MRRLFILLLPIFILFSLVAPVFAIGWDDGAIGNHLWSYPANWDGDTLPVGGVDGDGNAMAHIVGLQSNTPTSPIMNSGDVFPSSGILSHVIVGDNTTPIGIEPTLTINGGVINSRWLNIAWNTNPAVDSVVVMNDGTLNIDYDAGHFALGITSGGGKAFFTQKNGVVNCKVAIFCWDSADATAELLGGEFNVSDVMHMWSGGKVLIDGGVLNLANGLYANGTPNIDIWEGAFIINGNKTADVAGWISSGIITAYNGSGEIVYDYDVSNSGKTTVTANDLRVAQNPRPANVDAKILNDITLRWSGGVGAISHDVYFGTDYSEVANASRVAGDVDGNGGANFSDLERIVSSWLTDPSGVYPYPDVTFDGAVTLDDIGMLAAGWLSFAEPVYKGNRMANSYDPGSLNLFTTYYWRVDEVVEDEICKGEVWSFKPTIPSSLDRGHQLILKYGLGIQALVFPWSYPEGESFDPARWDESNFEIASIHEAPSPDKLAAAAPGRPWARWVHWDDIDSGIPQLKNWEIPYLDNLRYLQAADEKNLSDANVRLKIKAAFDAWKISYPEVICYTNQHGLVEDYSDSVLESFQQYAQPDMLCMHSYEFHEDDWWKPDPVRGGSPTLLYKSLARFRRLGNLGLDLTGSRPIPYNTYFHSYRQDEHRNIGLPEITLGQFAPMAFGYKSTIAFFYNDANINDSEPGDELEEQLFDGNGDSNPNARFYVAAENNTLIKNLAPALERLLSTDVRMKMGKYDGAFGSSENTLPPYCSAWSAYAVPFMSDVKMANPGSANDGENGDVVIGIFEPLDESFDGPSYTNETYFMVLNGLTDPDASIDGAAQWIQLDFDFGTSGINSLQKLNRDTGIVETVPLTHVSGNSYRYDFLLQGGRGDLFKFNTGAPFVGFYEGE